VSVRLEDQIISGLLYDEEYTRKVAPFIKGDYFPERKDYIIVRDIIKFFTKYNRLPSKEILEIEVLKRKDLTTTESNIVPDAIKNLNKLPLDKEWLLNETERYFQQRAVYLAILDSIQIIDGKDEKRTEDAIPSLLQEALGITFDMQIGHSYFDDMSTRHDFYSLKEEGILFDIDILNKITGGVGLRKKTLTCVAGPPGGGKSIFLCHTAASTLSKGKNVLYITMEMSEFKIAERIDANLLDIEISKVKHLDKKTFESRINKLKKKTEGNLVVKEFAPGSVHAGHFRALLEELKVKRGFVPDLICIDYLNICASQRVKNNAANSYTIIKSVSEELRAIAVDYDLPVLTGTQLTRSAMGASDVDMGDTSESIGITHTLDLYLAIINTDELTALGQVMLKQLKNRYGDLAYYNKFVVGLDKPKMRFFNLEDGAQKDLSESGQTDIIDEDAYNASRSSFARPDRGKFDFNFS